MAESVHKSSDIPNFDTYPATPSDEMADYKGVERAATGRSSLESSSLTQRAAELGAAAGRNALIRTESLRRRTGARVQELTHTVQDKAAELRDQAREKATELGRQARSSYYRVRIKANQTVREYPVETALAAGAVGFLLGVALRIRRASRA